MHNVPHHKVSQVFSVSCASGPLCDHIESKHQLPFSAEDRLPSSIRRETVGVLVGINVHMWVIWVTQRNVGDWHVERSGLSSDLSLLGSPHLWDGGEVGMIALCIEPSLPQYLLLCEVPTDRWPVMFLNTERPKIPVAHNLKLTSVFIVDIDRHVMASILHFVKLGCYTWSSGSCT